MANLGTFHLNDWVPIIAATHRFTTGAAFQPAVLTYSIYEEGNTTGIDENVDMVPAAPFDGIVGCYYRRRQLTAAAGFNIEESYVVVIKATVDGVSAVAEHTFQIESPSDPADVWAYASRSLTTWPAIVTYTGPVATGGDVVTYRGDSYLNADGRALEWESDDWFDLTGGTVRVIIDRVVQLNGSVVTPVGMAKVRLELTALQSAAITAGRHLFQVVGTQAAGLGSDVATLVEGSWVSRARATV